MMLCHLQSIIRRQANEISTLHSLQALDKKLLKRVEHPDTKKLYKKSLSKRAKDIAKLTLLQKALKKEVYFTLLDNSFERDTLGEFING